ncbi:MAG: ATP-binding protein [Gemmatimonadota bacterium]
MPFDDLLAEYREEARQQLEQLDHALLQLEESGKLTDDERLTLLRVLHTLKGNSAMIGLNPIADQVHVIENVFKGGDPKGGRAQLDRLFELSATLRSAVDRIGSDEQDAALNRVAAIDLAGLAEQGGGREDTIEAVAAEIVHEGGTGDDLAGEVGDPGSRKDVAAAVSDDAATAGTELIRVPFRKLDTLLAEVGELVGFHARLEDLIDRNRDALGGVGLRREFEESVQDLAARAAALRETTMELRLLPLRSVFGRFPGLVRELARSQDKQARLAIEGDETEVDKSAADALAEPLLHLIRNAVDHGIEAPEKRRRRGKDETGTIRLSASREGDHIRIEVSDDGPGLDRAAILRRAREAGIPVDDGLEDGDGGSQERTIRNLIFAPGFSTRAEASTVSGRGMGLDIVRRGIERLRGTLTVDAADTGGTRFELRLPLTLAIVPALIFESDGEILALPASEVRETLRQIPLERLGDAEVLRYHDRVVPVTRPRRIFGWESSKAEDGVGSSLRFAVVLEKDERTAAIPADRMIDQRNVVVKALPAYLGRVQAISGVTVSTDGRPVLLLDTQGMLDLSIENQRRATRGK